MLVKARVTEAVVVVIVPQVGNNVMFQPAVGGPYTLIAHVSRTICLPANEFRRRPAWRRGQPPRVYRRSAAVGGFAGAGLSSAQVCCGVRFVSGSCVWLCGVGLISARARDFIEVGARRGLWAFARRASDTF